MKASTPSLILFFIASFLSIAFRLIDHEMLELYCRATVIPSLFIYYLVSNNYKISLFRIIVLFLLFARDILVLLKINSSAIGSFSCVLLVYLLLLFVAVKEFKYSLLRKKDTVSVLLVVIGIGAVCYSVLNLKLENLVLDFNLYAFFGIVLSLLSIVTILNYFKSGTNAFFNALVMCICYITSDVFFMIFRFYFYNEVFDLISLITQFLSYLFMVKYFLEKDKIKEVVLI